MTMELREFAERVLFRVKGFASRGFGYRGELCATCMSYNRNLTLEEADAMGRERYLKSGGGRRFLKNQLRHHLQNHPLRAAGAPRAI